MKNNWGHITKEELMSKSIIDTDTGCWNWTRAKNGYGYGAISRHGRQFYAHRVSKFLFHDIPLEQFTDGKTYLACHHCDNPSCINPDHIYFGSSKDNKRDSIKRVRHSRGEMLHTSKVTEEDVREIYACYKAGIFQADIGEAYGLSESTVNKITSRAIWKHLELAK